MRVSVDCSLNSVQFDTSDGMRVGCVRVFISIATRRLEGCLFVFFVRLLVYLYKRTIELQTTLIAMIDFFVLFLIFILVIFNRFL